MANRDSIAWDPNYELGDAILGGSIMTSAFQKGTISTSPIKASTGTVEANIQYKIIKDSASYQETFSYEIGGAISVSSWWADAQMEAQAKYLKVTTGNSSAVHCCVMSQYIFDVARIDDSQLLMTPDALALAVKDLPSFYQKYGTDYIWGVRMGGWYSATFSFTCQDETERQEVAASINATFSTSSASGSVEFAAAAQKLNSNGRNSLSISVDFGGWPVDMEVKQITDIPTLIAHAYTPINAGLGVNQAAILRPFTSLQQFKDVTGKVPAQHLDLLQRLSKEYMKLNYLSQSIDILRSDLSQGSNFHRLSKADTLNQQVTTALVSITGLDMTDDTVVAGLTAYFKDPKSDKNNTFSPCFISGSAEPAMEALCYPVSKSPMYGGAEGSAWDDGHDHVIQKVSVRTGRFMDAIILTYENRASIQHGGNGGNQFDYILPDGVTITSVSVNSGRSIDNITIHFSNGDKLGPYGGSGGDATWSMSDPSGLNRSVSGFYGNTGDIVNGLGCYFS